MKDDNSSQGGVNPDDTVRENTGIFDTEEMEVFAEEPDYDDEFEQEEEKTVSEECSADDDRDFYDLLSRFRNCPVTVGYEECGCYTRATGIFTELKDGFIILHQPPEGYILVETFHLGLKEPVTGVASQVAIRLGKTVSIEIIRDGS